MKAKVGRIRRTSDQKNFLFSGAKMVNMKYHINISETLHCGRVRPPTLMVPGDYSDIIM